MYLFTQNFSVVFFENPSLDTIFNEDVPDLLYLFTDQIYCRLESQSTVFSEVVHGSVTWANLDLECHFTDYLHTEDAISCIDISLNGGKTFTQGCTAQLKTIRIPLVKVDSYFPVNSHVQDIEWITFSGERFD